MVHGAPAEGERLSSDVTGEAFPCGLLERGTRRLWNFVRADGIPRVLSGLATEPSETGEGFQSAREGEGEVHVCGVGW